MSRIVLVRYGEIGLKGRNRPAFEKQLMANIQAALQGLDVSIRREYGRIVVDPGSDPVLLRSCLEKVRHVFGVVSVSPAAPVNLSMDDLRAAAIDMAGEIVEKHRRGAPEGSKVRFKVEARRPNKKFPLQSPQISAELGKTLLKAFRDLVVDVHHPDFTVWVEIRENVAYLYTEILEGYGGLPIGSSGKGLLLLSGGIDSPVAGWLCLKRGISLEAIHFHSFPYTSERSLMKVQDLAARLARDQHTDIPLHVVNFTPIQDEIQRVAPAPSRITIMRRMMLRIAHALAVQRNIPVLVTGESVGQVASQTLESMAVINAVTHMPIIRPLVTMDKTQIIDIARNIGTYDISILPYDDCCSLFVPDQPETKPRLERIIAAESKMNVDKLVTQAVQAVEVVH